MTAYRQVAKDCESMVQSEFIPLETNYSLECSCNAHADTPSDVTKKVMTLRLNSREQYQFCQ